MLLLFQSLALVGAGTLKLQPSIPSSSPAIIIDSIWAETMNASPYLIHGDTLVLHAKISSTSGSGLPSLFSAITWLNQGGFFI